MKLSNWIIRLPKFIVGMFSPSVMYVKMFATPRDHSRFTVWICNWQKRKWLAMRNYSDKIIKTCFVDPDIILSSFHLK